MKKRWEKMEKRLDKRYNIPIRAILSFTDAPTQDLKTLNLSSGGAFILTKQTKPEGTEVFMSLLMDDMPDKQIEKGVAVKPKETEFFRSLFRDAMPYKKIGERIAIQFKGVVKRRYNYGMAVGFDNQYCVNRM